MATASHYLISNYDPEDRERLENETGQHDAEADIADPWLTEKPFGKNERIAYPPMFVVATIGYDEWASSAFAGSSYSGARELAQIEEEETIGGWYRSLERKSISGAPKTNSRELRPLVVEQEASIAQKKADTRAKKPWFLARALEASKSAEVNAEGSQPPTSTTTPTPSTSSLADMLARDPPPSPSQAPYSPPVWLSIGPGNRGFDILQKSGWEEGEALGRATRNRRGLGYTDKGKGREVVRGEKMEFFGEIKKEIIDLSCLEEDVIDLTKMDDEPENSNAALERTSSSPAPPEPQKASLGDLDHSPRALLTPLPTVLKADRLGIGLKAKTIGSGLRREPVKRVTHSQAALAKHVHMNETLQRTKKVVGRGKRGFERIKKREEEGRRNMLAYLNAE
ncbi:hypothetical protein DFH11DRAFT_1688832 [Phellopilus nigrolimitatus]|nr:hypothetical protein DFH11DRAFT_1688832 [Phellopilus nigrolimitatus]